MVCLCYSDRSMHTRWMYGSVQGHRVIAKDVMDVQVHSIVMTLSVSFVTSRRREGEAPVCVRLVARQMDRFLGGGGATLRRPRCVCV
jgi:hypothetical protein